jgi:hypothetical protein
MATNLMKSIKYCVIRFFMYNIEFGETPTISVSPNKKTLSIYLYIDNNNGINDNRFCREYQYL